MIVVCLARSCPNLGGWTVDAAVEGINWSVKTRRARRAGLAAVLGLTGLTGCL